jgi:23S rRNA-/tRNA-specific pseudouridylate synthase
VYAGETASTAAAKRNMLHAWRLAFPHPIDGRRISVEADPPRDFQKLLARLRAARD